MSDYKKLFMKETTKRPNLTGIPETLPNIKLPEIKLPETLPEIKLPEIKKLKKWNLNKILLICFFIFTIFFLYNCKYGMFKSMENESYLL